MAKLYEKIREVDELEFGTGNTCPLNGLQNIYTVKDSCTDIIKIHKKLLFVPDLHSNSIG